MMKSQEQKRNFTFGPLRSSGAESERSLMGLIMISGLKKSLWISLRSKSWFLDEVFDAIFRVLATTWNSKTSSAMSTGSGSRRASKVKSNIHYPSMFRTKYEYNIWNISIPFGRARVHSDNVKMRSQKSFCSRSLVL